MIVLQKLNVLNRIVDEKIMAIVRVETIERAFEIVDGCLDGGVSCLEISFTNSNASSVIEQLNQKYEERILLGAGTVLDSETARLAILKGAKFIIAPTFNEDVCQLCARYQVPYMPGCTSMSEALYALEKGADMIKVFPYASILGVELIKAMKVPVPYLPIMASGGINKNNIKEWIQSGAECLGIGQLLTKGSKEEIKKNAQELVSEVNFIRDFEKCD